eukprot:7727637-Pyramimonas_sp.AAC.1
MDMANAPVKTPLVSITGKMFKGAKLAALALEEAGVGLTFGVTGVRTLKLLEAVDESTQIQAVRVVNDAAASYAASAVWQSGAGLACALLTGETGVLEALSGVAHCKAQHIGAVVLVVSSPCSNDSQFQVPELDLLNLLQPLCKGVFKPNTGSEITSLILRAAALAQCYFPRSHSCAIHVNACDFQMKNTSLRAPSIGYAEGDGSLTRLCIRLQSGATPGPVALLIPSDLLSSIHPYNPGARPDVNIAKARLPELPAPEGT